MRLRQIALVAYDLAKARGEIEAVLGLDHAYDDPGVGKYGLSNAVFPVGDTFLEVVSPKESGTTAGRLIDKRGGDGGYMVILQVEDLAAARARATRAGVRIADQRDGDGFAFTHLHPKDIGGAIVSLDWMDPPGRWEWGGPGWQDHVRTDTVLGIVGAEVQADDPAAMAARWGEVLGLPPVLEAAAWRLELDGGEIRFVPVLDGRGEGLAGFDLALRDPRIVREAAEQQGLIDKTGSVVLAGTRVRLVAG